MSTDCFDENANSLPHLTDAYDTKSKADSYGKKKKKKKTNKTTKVYAITPRPSSSSLDNMSRRQKKAMTPNSATARLPRSKSTKGVPTKRHKHRHASPTKNRSRERVHADSNTNAPWTDSRELCDWTKMEIAEWLHLNWYTTNSPRNDSKLAAFCNIVKREKKFDGKYIAKSKDRDLGILAHKHLKLQKTDHDYKIFINRMKELQSKYAPSSRPSSRPCSRSASKKREKKQSPEPVSKSRPRSNTLPQENDSCDHNANIASNTEEGVVDYDMDGSCHHDTTANLVQSNSNPVASAKRETTANQNTAKKWNSTESPHASEERRRARMRLRRVAENRVLSISPKPAKKKKVKKVRTTHGHNTHHQESRERARATTKKRKHAKNIQYVPRPQPQPNQTPDRLYTHDTVSHKTLSHTLVPHRQPIARNKKQSKETDHGLSIRFNGSTSTAPKHKPKMTNRHHGMATNLNLSSRSGEHHAHKQKRKQKRKRKKCSRSISSLTPRTVLSHSNSEKKSMLAPIPTTQTCTSTRARDRERNRTRHRNGDRKKKPAARSRPLKSPKSCPPARHNEDGRYTFNQGMGMVVLANVDEQQEELEAKKPVQDDGGNKILQFSVTSPAGSPKPALRKLHSQYDGVTADELLQLISRGHSDEVDTDYDTDTNDIAMHPYDEYVSETPSPKHELEPSTYMSRLQLLSSSNSANNSNLSNISSVSSLEFADSNDSATSSGSKKPKNNMYTNHASNVHGGNRHNAKANTKQKKQYVPTHFRFSDSDISEYENSEDSNDDDDDDGLEQYKRKRERAKAKTCRIRVDSEENDDLTVTDLSLSMSLVDKHDLHHTRHRHRDSKHKMIVIPSIFSIGDSCSDVVLSPNAKMPDTDGLLLDSMVHYSITDESSDEDENNDIRESTNRIIEYALHNSPESVATFRSTTGSPLGNDNALPASAPPIVPRLLSSSSTKLAVLDDLAEFVNDELVELNIDD